MTSAMKLPFVLAALVAVSIASAQQSAIRVQAGEVVAANNVFRDSVTGVSLTYPAGWEVLDGIRWGPENRENTFRFRPLWPSETSPSLYYQPFRPDNPRPADVNAWLLENARKKEASRQSGGGDYRNDPDSVRLRTFNGKPGLSYVATFTTRDQKMAEYNLRVVGEKYYVMFFTFGAIDDVLAVRAEIDRMAESVQVP